MENKQYLIVISLIDGQNFTVPAGSPDKVEATVFAEARFGSASVLRSDPVVLSNANPEFGCELAWKISDRKILHQLRVERKAIKLQVFMQTRKKTAKQIETSSEATANGHETHQIELIGYTILDIRSADQTGKPKYKWCVLLNPKYKKPSYNRPEIQLALTLNRIDDDASQDDSNQFSSISSLPDGEQGHESLDMVSNLNMNGGGSTPNHDSSNDSNLYRTCLDVTANSKDEIIDNDIIIMRRNEVFYVYDKKHNKSSLEECTEHYRLIIKIPFSSNLDLLVNTTKKETGKPEYMFSINFFGVSFHTEKFHDLTSVDPKQIAIDIKTTNPATLATYFELNPDLDIKLISVPNDTLGITTIQLNQLSGLDMKFRCSIEGIFNMMYDEQYGSSALSPTIGVSAHMQKVDEFAEDTAPVAPNASSILSRGTFQDDSNHFLDITLDNTHQVTGLDDSGDPFESSRIDQLQQNLADHEILIEDFESPGQDDHHFCFTIDLMKYSYTSNKVFSRELIFRYTYPFFGYKDLITTEQSIPISKTSSIIVSGFCEFNFATNARELSVALRELPLNLEIIAADDLDNESDKQVLATCRVNMAKLLGIKGNNIDCLEKPLSSTSSVPIYSLEGEEIGELQIFLCVKDLGLPIKKRESFHGETKRNSLVNLAGSTSSEIHRLDSFISETRKNLDSWKEESFDKLSDELRRRDDERFRRLYQRLEAKETFRNQEFERRLEDLNNLKQEFHSVLTNVKSLERMLVDSIQHLKEKQTTLDDRLEGIETRLSHLVAISNQVEPVGRQGGINQQPATQAQATEDKRRTIASGALKNLEVSPRRTSLRNGVPISGVSGSVRSTSLVRRPSEGSAPTSRIVRRTTGPLPTAVLNGQSSRSVRSNSAKSSLSEEIQNLRKERAELLKRGCKPTDELIQEINSLIEKLAY